jgi:hypothetical protein
MEFARFVAALGVGLCQTEDSRILSFCRQSPCTVAKLTRQTISRWALDLRFCHVLALRFHTSLRYLQIRDRGQLACVVDASGFWQSRKALVQYHDG